MSELKLDQLKSDARIYFVGVGGISMSGLALLTQGYGFTAVPIIILRRGPRCSEEKASRSIITRKRGT